MLSKRGKFLGGGIALLFLFLFSGFIEGQAQEMSLSSSPPEKWIKYVLGLQDAVQKNQDRILRFLDFYRNASTKPASEYPIKETFVGTDNNSYKAEVDFVHIQSKENPNLNYDRTATIWRATDEGKFLKVTEVDWDSKKTGSLPGPEAAVIHSQNYLIHLDNLILNGQTYYRTHMQFAIGDPDKAPLRRGYVEILKDIQRQQTKISSSTMEGPANILPNQMKQINLQAIIGPAGYVYLRQDEGVPTRISKDHRDFCQNPSWAFVNQNSREWDESCAPLFDNSLWHGFSFSLLPFSYDSLLR